MGILEKHLRKEFNNLKCSLTKLSSNFLLDCLTRRPLLFQYATRLELIENSKRILLIICNVYLCW